ncbi:MAG: hypothetical protein ACRC5T_10775 [Cetobacterium sp.]
MSYARFGANNSDVYIFGTHTHLECCGCLLMVEELPAPRLGFFDIEVTHEYYPFLANTAREMLDHIIEHRKAGHHVPAYVDARLMKEFPDLDAPYE